MDQIQSSSGMQWFEGMLERIKYRTDKAIEAIGHVDHVAIVRHECDDQWLMILPDVSGEGRWRLQSFDRKGFCGHMVFGSKFEAIRLAAQQRHTVRDDGALDRLQDTPEFQIGLYAAEQLMLHNRGQISFEAYCKNVKAYREGHMINNV